MKGIKLGIIAICVALAGLSIATGNFFAYVTGGISVIIAILAFCVGDKDEN